MKRVVVIGSGRSASSLVANGLHRAGAHMGDELIGRGPSNPEGHWEDRNLVNLNNNILTLAGGSWLNPPTWEDVEALPTGGAVRDYLAGRERGESWGMKDPRLVLLWPAWWPQLRELDDLVVLANWRHPKEIAASLQAREKRQSPRGTGGSDAPASWLDLAYIYHGRLRRAFEEVLTHGGC